MNPQGKAPIKMSLPAAQQQNAIYGKSVCGPTFGGGFDFYISNNANTSGASYSNLALHCFRIVLGHTESFPVVWLFVCDKHWNEICSTLLFIVDTGSHSIQFHSWRINLSKSCKRSNYLQIFFILALVSPVEKCRMKQNKQKIGFARPFYMWNVINILATCRWCIHVNCQNLNYDSCWKNKIFNSLT